MLSNRESQGAIEAGFAVTGVRARDVYGFMTGELQPLDFRLTGTQ